MFGPHMHGNEPLMLDVLDGAEMTVNGGVMAQITGNRRGAIVRSGGTLRLHGTDFKFPDSTGTVPFIEQEAGGVAVDELHRTRRLLQQACGCRSQ